MDFLIAVENTALATWIRESPSLLAYAFVLFLHAVGLALVAGFNAAVDLRILGVAPDVPIAAWLETSRLAVFVNTTNWAWPACETLHFIGMALLIGCVGVLDLRMLGVGKQLAAGPLHRLIPYGVAGFAINFLTGIVFFVT